MGLAIISSNVYAQQAGVLLSPLKQIQSGVLPQDVKCKANFVLIINSKNNLPACVKPTTEPRLLERGWITPEKFEANPTMKYNQNKTQNVLEKNTNNGTSHRQISFAESNGTVPTTNVTGSAIQLSPGLTTPTISSTKPGIKIISIQMSPDPLKVSDMPQFRVTYQNISDKPIYIQSGCGATPLGFAISPSDSVLEGFPSERLAQCPIGPVLINPNQIETDYSSACSVCDQLDLNTMPSNLDFGGGFYQIMKEGVLHVTMKLVLRHELTGKYDQMETIQFNVNATR